MGYDNLCVPAWAVLRELPDSPPRGYWTALARARRRSGESPEQKELVRVRDRERKRKQGRAA